MAAEFASPGDDPTAGNQSVPPPGSRRRTWPNKLLRAFGYCFIVVNALLVVAFPVTLRSWQFGFSLSHLARIAFICIIYDASAFALLLYLRMPSNIPIGMGLALRIVAVMVLILFIQIAPAEIYCAVEEHHFKMEVRENPKQDYWRERWWPNRGSGIGYQDGRFWAHD